MSNRLFIRVCSALMVICLVLSVLTSAQIIRAYAEEMDITEDYGESEIYENTEDSWSGEVDLEPDPEPTPEPTPEPSPDSDPGYQPDPFDYNLACYTPNLDFGKVYQGTIADQKQFTIVNTGVNAFPLTWDTFDSGNAFVVDAPLNRNLEPGDSVTFYVAPAKSLSPGTYTASLVFYSANDIRQHHTTKVQFMVKVESAAPYVTGVEISPGSVTLPVGKQYQFVATVTGGNNFDPSVTWSIIGNTSKDTRISSGVLSVAAGEKASTITVIATSNQDASKVDTAVASLTNVDHLISVKAEPAKGGAVAGNGSVRDGSNSTVSASPNNNYRFKGWYENGNIVSDQKQYTLTNITSDRNLVAKFERVTCYVKTSVNNKDAGTITGSSSVQYGGSYTITAKANKGYVFEGFVEDNTTISNASSLELNNITSDRNIQAVFRRNRYNVNVSVYPQDTGKYEGAGAYDRDSKVKLTATSFDGYVFNGWTINGQYVSYDREYVIEHIKNDVNIVANFMKKEAKTYKLVSGIANEGGAIVPSGDYVAAEGSSVTYNMVPSPGYRILAVAVDGNSIGAVSSYTFNNIRDKHSIAVAFEKIPIVPAQTTPGSSTKSTVKKKTEEESTKSVEYTEETATQGAIPEQNIVDETPSVEVVELDDDRYEEDTYTVEDMKVVNVKTESSGVIGRYGLDEDTVVKLIHDRAAKPMLREAFEEGYLQVTINNSYAEDEQETSVEIYHKNPTLANFEDVVTETLTEDEQLAVLKGTKISFNVDISENTNTVDSSIKRQIQKKVGYKPITYFDFQIIKTTDGTSEIISNTDTELEVTIPIPEKFIKKGRKFYVMREHNGNVEILQDIGNNLNTVTFRTDKFSEYAIAYESTNINKLFLSFTLFTLIALLLALICFVALIRHKRMQRRAKRSMQA